MTRSSLNPLLFCPHLYLRPTVLKCALCNVTLFRSSQNIKTTCMTGSLRHQNSSWGNGSFDSWEVASVDWACFTASIGCLHRDLGSLLILRWEALLFFISRVRANLNLQLLRCGANLPTGWFSYPDSCFIFLIRTFDIKAHNRNY